MSIVHSKVSGLPNTDPGKVGGADWDHPHLYGPGSILLIGVASMDADPSFGVDTANAQIRGAITGINYDAIDQRLYFHLPFAMVDEMPVIYPSLPVVAGSIVDYFIDFSYRSAAFCPESLSFQAMDQFGVMGYDIGPYLGVNAFFSVGVNITAKLYASVA